MRQFVRHCQQHILLCLRRLCTRGDADARIDLPLSLFAGVEYAIVNMPVVGMIKCFLRNEADIDSDRKKYFLRSQSANDLQAFRSASVSPAKNFSRSPRTEQSRYSSFSSFPIHITAFQTAISGRRRRDRPSRREALQRASRRCTHSRRPCRHTAPTASPRQYRWAPSERSFP